MSGSVTEILAIATVLLLLMLIGIVMVQHSKLQRLALAVEALSRGRSAETGGRDEQSLVSVIGKALLETNTQMTNFDIVFSGMQAQLETIADGLQDLRAGRADAPAKFVRAEPVAPPPPPPSPDLSPAWPEPAAQASPALQTSGDASVLNEYRQLIAQPRKAEINRWADERGGISCTVNEDGSISALSREAGGLLVIIRNSDGTQLLLPGGRMVVEFATSFANMMSMRSVTRDCFELTGDGSGLLRLVDPARVAGNEGFWTLVSPGELSGFTG